MIINTTELKLVDSNNNIIEIPSLESSIYFPANIANPSRCNITIPNQYDIVDFTLVNDFVAVRSGSVNPNSYFQSTPTTITLKNGYYMVLDAYTPSYSPAQTYYRCYLYDSNNTEIGYCNSVVRNDLIGVTNGKYRDAGLVVLYDETNNRYLLATFATRLANYYTYVEMNLASSSAYSYDATTLFIEGALPSSDLIGTGGGATHIAKVTGLLSTLSSNLSDILVVAGGGGGGLISNETPTTGANGGGISGSGSNSADQTTGYAFGQGESSGGGSGLYGGYKAANGNSGGAGSGYIGNALLSNKKMVGYNVPTSDTASTKTESVETYSATAEADKPKAGNGFVRITWLRELE